MKNLIMLMCAVTISVSAMAQKELAFPFQGGQEVMGKFFKDNFIPSDDISQHNATGLVILKFTADADGNINKIVVYYADDFSLAQPAADLLKKSDHKWVIPDREKQHDFLLPLSISYNKPIATAAAMVKKKFTQYYAKRSPITTSNQIPLDMATLLPALTLTYDATL